MGVTSLSLPSPQDQRRIQDWVNNYPLSTAGRKGDTFRFVAEPLGSCISVLRILSQYFKTTLTSLHFQSNLLTDHAFQTQLFPLLACFHNLESLEITGNELTAGCLETFGRLFSNCQQLHTVNLSHNRIGGGLSPETNERHTVGFFLSKFFTEVEQPRSLDLSFNGLTDDSLYPLIKYTLANHECQLQDLNLEHNCFTARGGRTLLKAYSISPKRSSISLKFGPLPLGLENLRAGFVTSVDRDCISGLKTS